MADAWGVDDGYEDSRGTWRDSPRATVAAIHQEMGAGDDGPPVGRVLTVRLDRPLPPVPAGLLECEDGATLRVEGTLPPDVPIGYHRLQPDHADQGVVLIVSPGRCPATPERAWGWAAQLYATRSTRSWGHGDLADLARLTSWSATQGAAMTLINPLHAARLGPRQEPSPYFPSSRCFLSPLYLRVEDLPGAGQLDDLDALTAAGRALNAERLIDRDRVWALKSEACERIFDRFDADDDLDRFVTERGPALPAFATFNALAERHGPWWQRWPVELRRPDNPAVATFAASAQGARRVRYHEWLQWHTDRQLRRAAGSLPVMTDLAIGVDPSGADAWLWQDAFAAGMRMGAPPDVFNALGQDWGLPPWDPWRLRGDAYRPFIETLRGAMRAGGGLRVDHVMGLFRLFWIPQGRPPTDGAYVRYPYQDLLNIVALEAQRAGVYVVGEDLGTVEDRVRAELADRRVLSYRLLWFEPDRPPSWPVGALGSVTTHDLPTVAGVWSGVDLRAQQDLGLNPNEEASSAMRARLAGWAGLADDASAGEAVAGAYQTLAGAPCSMLTATLDDAATVEERPNMPGTVDEWPNWRLALPAPLEDIESSPLVATIAASLSGRRGCCRSSGPRLPGLRGERT